MADTLGDLISRLAQTNIELWHEEDKARRMAALLKQIERSLAKSGTHSGGVDYERVARITADRRGFPVSIMAAGRDVDATVATARLVENKVSYEWFSGQGETADAAGGEPAGSADGSR